MQEIELCMVTIPHSYTVNGNGDNLSIILDSLTWVNPHYHSYVGVEEYMLDQSVKIYPNPTTDYVFVELGEECINRHQETVMVFDIHGTLLQSQPVTDKKIQLDMKGYPSGLYLVKVGTYFGKVVKR